MQKSHNLSLKSKKPTDKWVFLRKQENGTVSKQALNFFAICKTKNKIKKLQRINFQEVFFILKLVFHFVNLVLTGFASGEELQLLVH